MEGGLLGPAVGFEGRGSRKMRPPLINSLRLDKPTLSSIPLRLHSEVNPVAACLIALYEQLIIFLLDTVGDVQEDRGIADGLLEARHTDIHGAARQVVARRSAPS